MNKYITALLFVTCDYLHTNRNLATTVRTSSELNPDLNGRASPLVISIYQLKDKLAFKSLSYEQLSRNPYKHLKSSLIDYTSLEIQPGQQRKIESKMNSKTLYLGIVAAYRNS
jgi:type VI secretion system protein VasD